MKVRMYEDKGGWRTLRWSWPRWIFRHVLLSVVRSFYRIRVHGYDNVPASGGALLVSNHVSYLDGPLLMLMTPRPTRPIVHLANFRGRFNRWWAELWGAIFIDDGPKAMVRALRTARQALQDGYLVCIFPEGGISRTGQLQTFRPGLLKILEGTDCPAIPVCLDELWGSVYSYDRGKFFWKWPRRWRYPIGIHYGKPIRSPQNVFQLHQEVAVMGATAVSQRRRPFPSLPGSFVRMCRKRLFQSKVADSNDQDCTGGQLLLRTLILRRLLLRHVLASGESYVGVLLPPSVGGVLANMALTLAGRIPVNLNYTASSTVVNECLAAATIRHVLTSRRVLSKLDLKLDAEIVYLEDFKDKVTTLDKLEGAVAAYALPCWLLDQLLGIGKIHGSDTATVIFTSGSTGTPKGVVLTFDNIASNVYGIDATVRLTSRDVVVGILPFFHSFGYTVTMWTPLALDMKAIYHFSPLDSRRIGNLIQQHGGTLLLSTPTFLRGFLKRCTPEQLKSLDVVVAGAEKLPVSLCDSFEATFGVRPMEGYGCTELSPLVSLNIPPSRSSSTWQVERKEGSVGRPIPGVATKVVQVETGVELPPGEDGMLLIRGPNVMKGYLDQPELTAKVLRDGWYTTGDLARLDEDGFIFITGRESRFSKIGGEMIPHGRIEEALAGILGASEDEGPLAVVTAIVDEKKGERLVVLHTKIDKTASELNQALAAMDLPQLFIPAEDSYFQVAAIPALGSGKLDLKGLKSLAERLCQEQRDGRKAVSH